MSEQEHEWNGLDLIEQLRRVRDSWMDPTTKVGGRKPLTKAAADEIERLRAEIEDLILVQVIEMDKRIVLEGEIERLQAELAAFQPVAVEDAFGDYGHTIVEWEEGKTSADGWIAWEGLYQNGDDR